MNYAISLIITIYNREDTLRRCIDSALHQTVENLEIILVDDCSTDHSCEIAQVYASQYSQICFLCNDKNRGPGYAKNHGVELAHGEYIAFLDSGDYLDPDYLSLLYQAILDTGSDMAVGDLLMHTGEESTLSKLSSDNLFLEAKSLAPLPESGRSLVSGLVISGFWGAGSAATKLIKKSAYQRFPFYEGIRCDDLPAVIPALATARQIVYVPESKYHYVQSNHSVERTLSPSRTKDAIASILLTVDRLASENCVADYAQVLAARSLMGILAEILNYNIGHSDNVSRELSPALQLLTRETERDLLTSQRNPYLGALCKRNNTVEWNITFNLLQQKPSQSFFKKMFEYLKLEKEVRPRVSIVIPVYNGANYMCQAIDSALAQTYENIEIIVVNDGSMDDGETDRIAKSYGEKIRYFSKPNGGVATALNLGIEKMTGEYFSWLSHDDMYTPEKIEQELRFLIAQEDKTTIIAEGYQVVDIQGRYLYTVNLHNQYGPDQLNIPLFALFRGGINGCALLIHKSHFQRVGMFDPNLPTTQDYDLWFRMFRGQEIYYAPTSNVLSRSHPEQGSKSGVDVHVLECDNLWINMMSGISGAERTAISGSPLLFYKELLLFLRGGTHYYGAIAYAAQMAYIEAIKEYRQKKDPQILEWICAEGGFSADVLRDAILPVLNRKKQSPRIAFFLEGRNLGGGLNRVVLQIAGLLAKQYEVYLICSVLGEEDGYPVPEKVNEIRIPWDSWDHTVGSRLVRLCYLLDTDLLISSYNCVPHCLDIYENAKPFGVRTIAWNHEFYLLPYWRSELRLGAAGRNEKLAHADAVVWINAFSAAAYAIQQQNGLCLPNPCTVDVPIEHGSKQRTKNLIAVGRFEDSNKGMESLLRMFARVVEQSPETELTILGSYDLQLPLPSYPTTTYQRLIRQLQIPEDKIHFPGWVSNVESYYANADIHVMPSIYEGFGLVILEAAAYGLPSVVYSGSGMDDIITDGVDGVIVPCGDWESLSRQTLELLRNENLYESMSEHAKKLPQQYAPEKVGALWCDVVDAVLHKDANARNAYFSENYLPSVSDREDLHRRIMEVYEDCISELATNLARTSGTDFQQSQQAVLSQGEWYDECMRLQQSLSWRITKPLRLIKKVHIVWKTQGFKTLVIKIRNRLCAR